MDRVTGLRWIDTLLEKILSLSTTSDSSSIISRLALFLAVKASFSLDACSLADN